MRQPLNRSTLRVATLLTALAAPVFAFAAGSNLLSPIVPQPGDVCFCATAMDWGCLLQVVQNVINVAITFGALMIVFWIMYAGAMMLFNPLNSAARTEARNRLLNAVIGLVVMLSSWLIVDYVMKFLYDPAAANFGPWNSILAGNADGSDRCIRSTTQSVLTTHDVGSLVNLPGVSGGGVGGGTCSPVAAGPCTPAALSKTCFTNRAEDASKICSVESRGDPLTASRGDRVDSGSGKPYSIGLWQVNLTNSNLVVDGVNCNTAFTNQCSSKAGTIVNKTGACSVHIVDGALPLYNKCVAAAQNPDTNTAVACNLSKSGSTFQPWLNTIGTCSIRKTF